VLFSGDGGFWYHTTEIETAVRWNAPVIWLVNNNNSLNQGVSDEIEARGGTLEGRHGDVWQFTSRNFAEIAKSMGAEGIRVDEPGGIRPALERALALGKPTVIDVVSDPYAEASEVFLG
jgi:acetolactate synthase-1/2/3 large subunit